MNRKIRIQIICEGQEEWWYMNRLLSFKLYNSDLYLFLPVINVKTNTQLVPRYQNEYANGKSDIILIFCDVDKDIEHFNEMVNTLATNISVTFETAKKLFIYANPVTLQIVLSHFSKVSLTHVAKARNSEIVEQLTGIKNYSAKEEQIKEMMNKITYSTYEIMKQNLQELSSNVDDVPSTNFIEFLNNIEGNDASWVTNIINEIKNNYI